LKSVVKSRRTGSKRKRVLKMELGGMTRGGKAKKKR